ncbi:TPA: hypothetical protein JBE90_12070 [Legionella pneumophila]|uniref:hypothetical protein n=1 Tax=Legionella pneumophila TaxID=446 RepID=UPI000D082071|nr:hypothetical protein [Legionella pneumophila]HAU0153748.1 hypothetical protein [Legionella pneumophila]
MTIVDQMSSIDSAEFTNEFLRKYFEIGFGSLSKHDIDLLVYYLIKKHTNLINEKSNYELSALLTITERKLQSIQIESYLRYESTSISKNLEILRKKIESKTIKPEIEGDKIRILIDSPVLRRDFEYSITSLGYIVDYSFNKNILTLRLPAFFEVLTNLDTEKGKALKKQITDFLRQQTDLSKDIKIEIENKSWWSKQFKCIQSIAKKEVAAFIFQNIISILKESVG